ncbi:MAG: hypothetical protein H7X71_06300 [Chitinophagales bacterium]|nr:hypothetical protein [Chitinophagales bacterium]
MKKFVRLFCLFFIFFSIMACNKDVKTFTYVNFSILFDETQERLNNTGDPASIPAGYAAQTPEMKFMSVYHIELSPDEFTPFKGGQIVYKAPETKDGGSLSIDHDSSVITSEGLVFYTFNISKLAPGTYNYLRVGVAYQEFEVLFNLLNIPSVGNIYDQTGTVASFIGYRTYIRNLTIKNLNTDIFADKEQGFWGIETALTAPNDIYNTIYTGQSPAGTTTVVNPIASTSPLPPGTCIVTGKFATPLVIAGNESEDADQSDLTLSFSFSTNQSFEWVDTNTNGQWDVDAVNPALTEQVIDMGLRGMIPFWEFE